MGGGASVALPEPSAALPPLAVLLGEDVPVAGRRTSAREAASWRTEQDVWLDHVTLVEADVEWLEPATSVTAWAVRTPHRFWSRLPNLVRLDLRGGSGEDLDLLDGCTSLQWLSINQIRGVSDLAALEGLTALRFLSLYGLPRVGEIPSLAQLKRLQYTEVGSMKGLRGLTGLLDAPNLEELTLIRAVRLGPGDADAIAEHPSIRAFSWFAEDVPISTREPVVERVSKPRPTVNIQTWPLPDAEL